MIERTLAVGPLDLTCGARLDAVDQFVTLDGDLRPGAPVVLVPHALTGTAFVRDWWGSLIGPGKPVDTDTTCIIGINVLGGCTGSTGPSSPAPDGRPYGSRFPLITVADMVAAQRRALEQLGITRLTAVIGGSLGGMQALQWALDAPDVVEHAVIVGAYDHFAAGGIAFNAVALGAIRNDPAWNGGDYYGTAGPVEGLRLARKLATITYKSDELFTARYGRRPDRKGEDPYAGWSQRFDIEGYLDEQADRLVKRFDANTYLVVSRAMDLFETRDRTAVDPRPRLTFVGISSDMLFPPQYVRAAADRFAALGLRSRYLEQHSAHGHDAFLADAEQLAGLLRPALAEAAAA